jgi:hypothetical protein
MSGAKRDSIGGMRYAGASSSSAVSLLARGMSADTEFESTLGIGEGLVNAEAPKMSWNSVCL